jgi:hypothetical protein
MKHSALRWVVLLFAVVLFLSVAQACDMYATCPIDNETAQATGRTKIMNGHQWGEFRHLHGTGGGTEEHVFWAQL